MKDERAHLQLFDLIAREWVLASPATAVCFNANNTAAAFACADGAIHLATTQDKEGSNLRIRRAVDTARLTIAPRTKPVAPLKIADHTKGRTSVVVPHGAANFAFANASGRINTLTLGGISVHLPAKAPAAITALAISPTGSLLAYSSGDQVQLASADASTALILTTPSGINSLGFSPDGLTLAAAQEGGVSRWSVTAPELAPIQTPFAGSPSGIVWRRDGAWLATCLQADGFCVINSAANTATPHGNFPTPVRSLGFGDATNSIVVAGAFRVAAWALDDQRDIISGKPGLVPVNAVATCPTRNLVAVGYANGLLSLAEIGQPSEILLREDTGAGVTAMAWSGCGTYLAVAGADGSAALVEFPDSMFKS